MGFPTGCFPYETSQIASYPSNPMSNTSPWFFWAVLSAVFAALTAIFAKIGIKGVDSDLATLVRTGIIIIVVSAFA